jgi:hypothetical protein
MVVLVLLLGGCATPAQMKFQAMKTGNQQALAQFKICGTEVYNSPEYAPLRTHIPFSVSDVTLEQLSDQALANRTEVKAIYTTHPKLQECRKALLAELAQSEPSLVPIFIVSFNKNEDDLLQVVQRKMAWGDFVRQIRDRSAETQAALQAENRRVVSGLQQEHEAEMEQRQRAAEALAAWAQTQQLINAADRPVVTNCNAYGGMVNCVSH